MATDKISISPEIVSAQIGELGTLIADTRLSALASEIKSAIETSAGNIASNEKEASAKLGSLQTNMALLFARARDFLSNTNTNFIDTDSAY